MLAALAKTTDAREYFPTLLRGVRRFEFTTVIDIGLVFLFASVNVSDWLWVALAAAAGEFFDNAFADVSADHVAALAVMAECAPFRK